MELASAKLVPFNLFLIPCLDPKDFEDFPSNRKMVVNKLVGETSAAVPVMNPHGDNAFYKYNFAQCPGVTPIILETNTNFTNNITLGLRALDAVERDF